MRPSIMRFLRRTDEGMQRPPIFEADDGHDYVLKLDYDDPDFPAAELVAAHLALALGVPLPAFEVLAVPEGFAEALVASEDPDLTQFGASFQRLEGLVFGSRFLKGATTRWTSAMRTKIEDADVTLLRLLVFDAFIENGDRTSSTNPNLLACGGRLFAIDHGQALPAVQGVVGKSMPYAFDSHLAWEAAREHPHLFDEPVQSLRALPDRRIEAAVRAVPAPWWTDLRRPELVVDALKSRRTSLPDTIEALRSRLA